MVMLRLVLFGEEIPAVLDVPRRQVAAVPFPAARPPASPRAWRLGAQGPRAELRRRITGDMRSTTSVLHRAGDVPCSRPLSDK